jgi:hypothetical protein
LQPGVGDVDIVGLQDDAGRSPIRVSWARRHEDDPGGVLGS